jgi:hypothetical protein
VKDKVVGVGTALGGTGLGVSIYIGCRAWLIVVMEERSVI